MCAAASIGTSSGTIVDVVSGASLASCAVQRGSSLGVSPAMPSDQPDVDMVTIPPAPQRSTDVEVDLITQVGPVRLHHDPKTLRSYLINQFTQEALGLPFVGDFKHELLFDESGFGFIDFDSRPEGRDRPIWLGEVLRLQVFANSGGDRFVVERSSPRLANKVVHRVPEFFRACVAFEVAFSFGVPPAERKMPLAYFPPQQMRRALVLAAGGHQSDVRAGVARCAREVVPALFGEAGEVGADARGRRWSPSQHPQLAAREL